MGMRRIWWLLLPLSLIGGAATAWHYWPYLVLDGPHPIRTDILRRSFRATPEGCQVLARRSQRARRAGPRSSCVDNRFCDLYLLSWTRGQTAPARAEKVCALTTLDVCAAAGSDAWPVQGESDATVAVVNGELGRFTVSVWTRGTSGFEPLVSSMAEQDVMPSPDGRRICFRRPGAGWEFRSFPFVTASATSLVSVNRRWPDLANDGRLFLPDDFRWFDPASGEAQPFRVNEPAEFVRLAGDTLVLKFPDGRLEEWSADGRRIGPATEITLTESGDRLTVTIAGKTVNLRLPWPLEERE